MANKRGDTPQVDAAKRASLSIAWAAVAGIAYLGLIKRGLDAVGAAAHWNSPAVDAGLYAIPQAQARIGGPYATLGAVAITAIPVALVAAIALGVATRIRPHLVFLPSLLFIAGLIGLIGTLLLGYTQLVTPKKELEFGIALGTIVIVSILLRLQRFIRRFYRRAPAVASLLVAVLALAYLVLSNGTSISAVFLEQIDIWLGLIAFAIVLYNGIQLVRASRRVSKAR